MKLVKDEKRVSLLDHDDIGTAILESKAIAEAVGFNEKEIVLISTVVSELSTNIIRYAKNGEIIVKIIHDLGRDGLEIIALDEGPGIPNIEEAMKDNFSTTLNSLGLGLSSVKRIMDYFKIESAINKGTKIVAKKWKNIPKENNIDYFCTLKPLLGTEEECGDIGLIEVTDTECYFGLIDAVGHGIVAHDIAVKAKTYILNNINSNPSKLLSELHEILKPTRGAVIALGKLNVLTGETVFSGIGNIQTKILGPRTLQIIPNDGIVGYMMSTPKEQRIRLHPGDILIMTSDGVKEHFDPLECTDLFSKSAEIISKGMIDRYGKKEDDASCLIIKLKL